MDTPFKRIYQIVEKIPEGKIMTYGQIAKLAKVATPRIVGFAMHSNKTPETVPCHRVIFTNGSLTPGYAFGGIEIQKKILQEEGVIVDKNGKVDISKFQYTP